MMPLLRVLFLDTPGHPTSAPQKTETVANTPYMQITIRNLGIASSLCFQGRTGLLMDSHPYSYETTIFILGVPHE